MMMVPLFSVRWQKWEGEDAKLALIWFSLAASIHARR
jgi:hypothetical protein